MTQYLVDISRWQVNRSDPLDLGLAYEAGFGYVNVALNNYGTDAGVWARDYVDWARDLGMGVSTYWWLRGNPPGAYQAALAFERMCGLGGPDQMAHIVDIEDTKDPPDYHAWTEYVDTMQGLLGRPIANYSGDWWWASRGWVGVSSTPYLHAAPNSGYLGEYPGDTSPHWTAGYGGWNELSIMQYAVAPLPGTGKCSLSAIRNPAVMQVLVGGSRSMPDFTLHSRPPNEYITDAEWWLWQAFHVFEPKAKLGGIYADKSGFHNTGNANMKKWPGNYSVRDAINSRGPWWKTKASAIDFTFPDAQAGNYSTIDKYTSRLMASARNAADPRLDKILFEFYGQDDNDKQVEGYNEYREEFVTSDPSHLWHLHISFRRESCGDFWAMWALLTVLMGWSVAAWQATLPKPVPIPEPAPIPEPEEDDVAKQFFIKVAGQPATWLSDGIVRRPVTTYGDMKELSAMLGISLSSKEVADESMLDRLGGVLIEPTTPPIQ